jgi:hypothetical protein
MESTDQNASADEARADSPPRKWQFSLRSLVVVMAICSLLLGRYGVRRYEIAREQAALTRLQALGGDAQFRDGRVVGISFSGKGPPEKALELLERLPELERLVFIESDLDDAGLQRIAELEALEQLLLLGARISDEGVAHIARLEELRVLRLDRTQVGDEGLRRLAPLANLERIDLAQTRVTDGGLKHLAALPSLHRVYLSGTAVTKEGAAWLERELPHATISR